MTEALQWAAIGISTLTLILLILEKTFGGGNSLANKFAVLDKDLTSSVTELKISVTADMAKLRLELTTRVDEYEDNYAVGLDAIKSNIHAMQLGLLEFRAKMAEDYVHKSDHSAGLNDLKRDVREGFDRVEKRLSRIESGGKA
jgi:hypothetical protein